MRWWYWANFIEIQRLNIHTFYRSTLKDVEDLKHIFFDKFHSKNVIKRKKCL
jgi:hypothetical protein